MRSGAHAAADRAEPAPAAVSPGNPALLGITGFLPGGLTLGLWLIGYLPTALPGGMIAAVSVSSGLFLLIATLWAARLEASTVSAVLGVYAAFWLSFGFMLMGLSNKWFGLTSPDQAPQVLAPYTLAWLIVFVFMTIATLRLPLVFTAGFVFVDVTFALVYANVVTGTSVFATIAGFTTFVFCAVYAYILFDGLRQDLGAPELPMGAPILR
ncbi:succinate-acetate transporter protein [Pseudonocardia eucalypti]|uniref:acetate uptake transporter family protein n=1 Tax=Pseudonocardia eucalypti TaxID=648755 RepID=UPI0017A66F53|nr:succinate-acetate transporter protein [Pseudonocardia eucalypti]